MISLSCLNHLAAGVLAAAVIVASGCSSRAAEESGDHSVSTGSDGSTTGDDEGSSTSGGTNNGSTTGAASSGTSGGDTGSGDTDSAGEVGDDLLPGYELGECAVDSPSTFSLDLPDSNGTVSPVQSRMAILDGWGVFGALYIRPWEFLAYYPFAYPAAPAGELAVHAELYAPEGLQGAAFEVQVAVTGPYLAPDKRPPVDLTLVVDNSGSMKGVPLTVLKAACTALAKSLRPGDTVSLVTWESDAPVILAGHAVAGPLDPALIAAIEGLEATGGSDLFGGLSVGYELASAAQEPGRVGRVVLMSDGGAAVDAKTLALIASHASDADGEGIDLIGVGVGTYGGYQPALMDSVAALGRGPTVFVGSVEEANQALVERFLSLTMVAAREVEVELILPPGFARALPPELTHDGDVVPAGGQPLPQNGAVVLYERLSSCAPELLSDASEVSIVVRYRDVESYEEAELVVDTTLGELLAGGATQLHKGAAIVRYAEALRLWNDASAEIDVYAAVAEEALARIDVAQKKLPGDPSLAEIRGVLETLLKSMV